MKKLSDIRSVEDVDFSCLRPRYGHTSEKLSVDFHEYSPVTLRNISILLIVELLKVFRGESTPAQKGP